MTFSAQTGFFVDTLQHLIERKCDVPILPGFITSCINSTVETVLCGEFLFSIMTWVLPVLSERQHQTDAISLSYPRFPFSSYTWRKQTLYLGVFSIWSKHPPRVRLAVPILIISSPFCSFCCSSVLSSIGAHDTAGKLFKSRNSSSQQITKRLLRPPYALLVSLPPPASDHGFQNTTLHPQLPKLAVSKSVSCCILCIL